MSTDYDVIIVGAGPAGSAAAYSLAKNGHQVLILERGKEPVLRTSMEEEYTLIRLPN